MESQISLIAAVRQSTIREYERWASDGMSPKGHGVLGRALYALSQIYASAAISGRLGLILYYRAFLKLSVVQPMEIREALISLGVAPVDATVDSMIEILTEWRDYMEGADTANQQKREIVVECPSQSVVCRSPAKKKSTTKKPAAKETARERREVLQRRYELTAELEKRYAAGCVGLFAIAAALLYRDGNDIIRCATGRRVNPDKPVNLLGKWYQYKTIDKVLPDETWGSTVWNAQPHR